MENVELALKNTNRKEKALIGAAQNLLDFSVDDLLDFSNDDVFVEDDEAELKLQQQRKKGVSVSSNDKNALRRSNGFSTAGEDFGSLHTSELSVPMDDIAELEWLSNFVEDSFTPSSALTNKPIWLTGNRRHSEAPVKEEICFKSPPPVQIRSKRARTGFNAWSLTDSTSSSSSSSSGPSSPPWLSGAEFLDDSMVKRQKKKKVKKESEVWKNDGQTQTRRCSHCGVQKTPQWRGGPLGAKTLCNACGVRFKSGRLLPEYRPACSPTFSSELHSNHHRKVIEMRRKKETSDEADETGLDPLVQKVQVVPIFKPELGSDPVQF